ncbi:hypothetical protein BANRA_05262 [Escherichia coli]|uniref:Amidohydrolase n=1 Tax=Escherichia coli TaxID=562 RepID=A0A3P5DZE7_ECOLX|nr:hypothetical protein BANRA_05262 [Escherichia coli]
MIFDTHAHVFVRGLPLAEHCRYVPDYDATPESYLTHLDRFGIDVGILVQPSFLGTDNHYMRGSSPLPYPVSRCSRCGSKHYAL